MPKDTVTDAIVSRYRTTTPTLPRPVMEHWDWQRDASCRTTDVTVFFPPNSSRGGDRALLEAHAKAVCVHCPVQNECRSHALTAGEPYGIWGGTTPKERALLSAGH
ncbi:WhiB family transcriptional regulator [Williamsia sp. R60]